MKIPTFLKTILFVALISISFFSKAQVPPGIVPANGIPVLVPATVSDLNTPNGYCQLSYGTSGLPRSITNCNPLNLAGHQTGNSGNSHVVITTSTYDSLACYENIPGQYLSTLPSITFWDTLIYGPLRVMQLGDEQAGSYPFASAASTYYFTPTEEQNLLFLWVAFVTEAAQHHDKSENGLFRIELTDLNGNYVTGNYYTSTLYVIPETTSDPILHPCCQAQYLNYSCPGPQMNPPSNINNRWGDWEQLVFDLTPYIGQIVKLRFIISECLYQAHYTYGYYTGFGANGNLTLQSCNLDSTSFQAPIGFTNYKWYINDVYVPAFNGLQEISMDRNTTDTLFKCEISLEYSDTIVFSKTVNYYSIDPDFTWEQQINNENYIVQFTNTSSLINNTNNMNIPENIEYLLWDFGDGTTSSEQNPIHYYSGIGPYNVTLKVFDNQNVYNESIYEQVLLSGVSVNEMNNKDLSCKAYPNPFKEEIILEVYNTSETVSFEIFNILGQVVSRGNINKEGKVRTHHFKAGLYFIKFMHGNQTYYSKLVKE